MIDDQGYRANVAIAILNRDGKFFWGKRRNQKSYQFPQGGVKPGETALVAMYRELFEEVGLLPQHVEVLAATPHWLRYHIPKHLIRSTKPTCIGQKQKWFLLQLCDDTVQINLQATSMPEFDSWRWVDVSVPVCEVIYFKRDVYQSALDYFSKWLP